MKRLFFVTLCVLAAVLPVGMGMGAAQAAPAPTVDPAPECGDLSDYETTEEYRACLEEHTSTEEVLAITSTAPANASTKATDAIYAVDVSEANETVSERAPGWMTGGRFGVKPEWSDAAADALVNGTDAETSSSETPAPTAAPTETPDAVVENVTVNRTTETSTDPASSTSTAAPTETETPAAAAIDATGGAAAEADTLETQQTIRMGEHTEIVGWEFVDGRVRIGIATERTQRVTMADQAVGLDTAGASKIPEVDERIYGGETTIVSMPVESAMGGYAVGVAAGDSSIRLTTEMDTSGNDPLRHFGGTSGLFSGFLQAVIAALGAAWYVLRTEESGVVKA